MNAPDAGTVIRGIGTGACAFGIAAARALGRYDHLGCLASQALVASWPLPNGTLLAPRFLSNFTEAPYLGEACTLFAFAHRPQTLFPATPATVFPRSVYMGVAFYALIGIVQMTGALLTLRRWRKHAHRQIIRAPRVQVRLWAGLMILAVIAWFQIHVMLGFVFLLAGQLLPRMGRRIDERAKGGRHKNRKG